MVGDVWRQISVHAQVDMGDQGAIKVHFFIYIHYNITFLFTKGQLCKYFQRKITIIFLSISFNMCFGSSKEPSQ